MSTLRRSPHDFSDDETATPRRRLNSRAIIGALRLVRFLEVDASQLKTFDRVCPKHHVVLKVTETYLLECPASDHLVERWLVQDRQTGQIVDRGTIRLDDEDDDEIELAGGDARDG